MIYRGLIQRRLEDAEKPRDEIELDIYKILVPTINQRDSINAYVMSLPGIFTSYNEGDQVIVTKLVSSNKFIILGLLQRSSLTTTTSEINIDNISANRGILSGEITIDNYKSLLEIYNDTLKID